MFVNEGDLLSDVLALLVNSYSMQSNQSAHLDLVSPLENVSSHALLML